MKISALQAWLEEQKAQHGDIEVVCMTAPCNDPMGQVLSVEELRVSTPSTLGMSADELADDAAVLAIGYGN
ncbi:hypothetical protein D9M71_134610 [compost metagenome]